jgi:hypothetical protein
MQIRRDWRSSKLSFDWIVEILPSIFRVADHSNPARLIDRSSGSWS